MEEFPDDEVQNTAKAWHVRRPGYHLVVRKDRPTAWLADENDTAWTTLSLLASVHRIDAADETLEVMPPRAVVSDGVVAFTFPAWTAAWEQKQVVLEAREDAVHLRAEVIGVGTLEKVTLAGGDRVDQHGGCGRFRSSIRFGSLFTPAPTEPIQVVRPASSSAVLGIVGDAAPGRLHSIFSPPPLTFAVSRAPSPGNTEAAPSGPAATTIPDGPWLGISVVADVKAAGFTQVAYDPLDGGWNLTLDYDGHTRVTGEWVSPTVRLKPVLSPWAAIVDLRQQVLPTPAPTRPPVSAWWLEPIFCGWGSQCARVAAVTPPPEPGIADGPAAELVRALSRQGVYDEWLTRLAKHDIVPGTIVIDDKWQAAYGLCSIDEDKWPDLKGWIAARHAAGQRVLLWFKAWDPEGLPANECVLDSRGRPVAADPSSEAYLKRLARTVRHLVSPDGVDADGFKVDFTQRGPSGRSLISAGDHCRGDGVWGMAALHRLLATLRDATKSGKADALVVTHAVDPRFRDVTDMIRLNDVLKRDPSGVPVPVVAQLRFRSDVVAAAMPGVPVDTDQWPMPDKQQWLSYVAEQPRHGVPALYYVDALDRSGEELDAVDLQQVAHTWETYRKQRRHG